MLSLQSRPRARRSLRTGAGAAGRPPLPARRHQPWAGHAWLHLQGSRLPLPLPLPLLWQSLVKTPPPPSRLPQAWQLAAPVPPAQRWVPPAPHVRRSRRLWRRRRRPSCGRGFAPLCWAPQMRQALPTPLPANRQRLLPVRYVGAMAIVHHLPCFAGRRRRPRCLSHCHDL